MRPLLLSCLVAALLASPSPAREVAETADFLDIKTIGAVQIQAVSTEGTAILARIADARAAIRTNNLQKARFETAQARALLQDVRYKSPAVRIQDKIARVTGLARESKATTNDLQPIFAELDAIESVEVMADVREQVEVAKGHVENGNHAEAAEALVVATTHIAYLEIDLPIHETLVRVNRANFQLRHHDPLAASASLGEAASHVEIFVAIASRTEVGVMRDVGAGPQ